MRSSRYNGGPHGAGSCDSAHSAAERSYPTSEVGAEAGRTPCPRGGGQEELPHIRGQGRKPGGPHARGAAAKRSYPTSEVRGGRPGGATQRPRPGAAARRTYPTPEARGSGWEEQPTPEARGSGREDQPHVQGAVAARAQEGLEELSHTEGQEGRR